MTHFPKFRLLLTIGFIIFSFSNCVALSSIDPPLEITKVAEIQTGGTVLSIVIKDDLLFIVDHLGLLIYNISIPSDPIRIGENLDGGTGHDIYVEGNYAFIADLDEGLEIYDVQDPFNPQKVGTFYEGIEVAELSVQESICYATVDTSTFAILNVSEPTNIVELSEKEISASCDICYIDDTVYVSDWYLGLLIYDIQDVTNPILVGNYDDGEVRIGEIFAEDKVIYAACRTDGFRVLNISDPMNPILIGEYVDMGDDIGALGVYKQNDYAFVCDYDEGLKILDVKDPTNPQLRGFYGGNRIFGVRTVKEYVYLVQSGGIIQILQIPEKITPTTSSGPSSTPKTTSGFEILIIIGLELVLIRRKAREKRN